MHNTKISDFDIKRVISMLTEQFYKNQSLVQSKNQNCISYYKKIIFYALKASCNEISTDLSIAQNVDIQIEGITQK